jgi:signal peptidase II
VVLLAVFRFRYQITIAEEFFVGMIIGGAFGNLVDRLRLGYVVDFIELPFWPIFNAADSFLVVGAVLLLITYYRRERRAHRAHSI